MKTLLFISFLLLCFGCFAQTDSGVIQKPDTGSAPNVVPIAKPIKKKRVVIIKQTVSFDSLLVTDSIRKIDTVRTNGTLPIQNKQTADSVRIAPKKAIVKKPIDSIYLKLLDNPFLRTKNRPIFLVINERKRVSKDEKFYLVLGLLLFLAFVKLVFAKYFQNLFRVFFQPSFKQKQTREQLQQGNLPSLLLNFFFILSASAYTSFLLDYYHLTNISFWQLLAITASSLIVLYIGKFLFITFAGWVFNAKEASDSYIFAIYLINKILGVILIPFTLIIAFSKTDIINISITISILLILLLFLYRYLVSYGPVRREIKVSPLHFFFYIFAFEITPLLLIYKTLLIYMNKSL